MDLQAQIGLHDRTAPHRQRGALAWLLSATLIGFYATLYWTDVFEPVAQALHLRHKWFLYGLLYTLVMAWGAARAWSRHGNSRYQRYRIAVNLGVQAAFGFAIPWLLPLAGAPEAYLSYFWPLKIDALYPSTWGGWPTWLAVWSLLGALVLAPVMALAFGKRWYCSWVCGCGGLANTFGDDWRHLSDRSTRAWRFEQVSVHGMLIAAVLTTALVALGGFTGSAHAGVASAAETTRTTYGFVGGALLSGVLGTGLYPVLGPRVWCRYFCPMAALLGLVQRLGRFRVRVQPDLCIACGNCSVACEMGIDVRAYAMANTSFTRASCVGCGLCAHVCPRGVLRLENTGPVHPEFARTGTRVMDL